MSLPDSADSRRLLHLQRVAFVLVLVAGVLLMWWGRLRYWFPHDEGILAQGATFVMQGLVPHRDFGDPYSGALSVIHSAYMRLFGESLASIRLGFFIFASVWFVVVVEWFRRRSGVAVAAVAGAVIVTWSVPMYSAAMPSWYVLFLTTFALISSDRFQRTGSTSALFWAGACLGLAVSIKVTALYAVAGALVGVMVLHQARRPDPRGRLWVILALPVMAALAVALVWSHLTGRIGAHILLPPLVVTSWAWAREIRDCTMLGVEFGLESLRAAMSLVAGVLGGMVPWLIWLVWTGAFPSFLASLAQVSGARAGSAAFAPPTITALGYGLALLLVIAIGLWRRAPRWPIVLMVLLFVFWRAWEDPQWHRVVWQGARGLIPIGLLVLVTKAGWHRLEATSWVMPATITGWMALTQFPFAAPIYFIYITPLVAWVIVMRRPWRPGYGGLTAMVAASLALFALTQMVPGTVRGLGHGRALPATLALLVGPRGGILVPPEDSVIYSQVLVVLRDEVGSGVIWAGPDSPEVAWLADRTDANRTPFSFLALAGDRFASLWQAPLAAVVVRDTPSFSEKIPLAVLTRVRTEYPVVRGVGPFTIYSRTLAP